MGEIIRSRGLATAVGVVDASGRVRPAYCASACVLVYAGGKTRYGVEGSMLGVHRFVTRRARRATPSPRPSAIAGMVLELYDEDGRVLRRRRSHVRDRGMSAGSAQKEASAMNLVTDPVGRP